MSEVILDKDGNVASCGLIDPIIMNTTTNDRKIDTVILKMGLKTLRLSHHMTQEQVAAATGLSVQCISDIESPRTGNPTLRSLMKYMDIFGHEFAIRKKVL